MVFRNRLDAGKQLAEKLLKYIQDDPIIIAIPRGGVVVGSEVARSLKAPLDVIIVRKIGSPHNPEFGIGAIAEGDTVIKDEDSIAILSLTGQEFENTKIKEAEELQRRVDAYRKGKPLLKLKDRTVILVDDGLATGVTVEAAIKSLRKLKPKKIIVAVPVCSSQVAEKIKTLVDELICIHLTGSLRSIGEYYQNFDQVLDDEVIRLLRISLPVV